MKPSKISVGSEVWSKGVLVFCLAFASSSTKTWGEIHGRVWGQLDMDSNPRSTTDYVRDPGKYTTSLSFNLRFGKN